MLVLSHSERSEWGEVLFLAPAGPGGEAEQSAGTCCGGARPETQPCGGSEAPGQYKSAPRYSRFFATL